MDAGHGGASGRFDRLHETAFATAFALKVVGRTRVAPPVPRSSSIARARDLRAIAPPCLADAYARTIARGPDGVELDVRVTADGVPIVAHDPTTRVLSRMPRQLATTRFGDLPAGMFLPLQELMPVFAGFPGRVYVEIKDTGVAAVNRALDVLEPFRSQVWFISLPWKRDALSHVRDRWNDARTNRIVIRPGLASVEAVRAAGGDAMTFGWSRVNAFRMIEPASGRVRRLIDAAQAVGIEVSAGLANSAGDLRWAARMGFEMVWVDPHMLDRARDMLPAKAA